MNVWHAMRALVVAAVIGANPALGAQSPPSPARSQISGVVYDSISRRPLAGADVQLQRSRPASVDSSSGLRAVLSDASGRFEFDGLEEGTYLLTFFHSAVDSLGVNMPLKRIELRQAQRLNITLASPSQTGVIALICGQKAVSDSSALLMGYARDATTLEPAAASVLLQWDEVVIGNGGMHAETKQITTNTRRDGWYAFCNVPVENLMQLRVARSADTSGVVAADLSGRQVVRRDLYIGVGNRVTLPASPNLKVADAPNEPETTWRGPARVSGRVLDIAGRPVAGARVHLVGSEPMAVTSDDSGRYELANVPSGSQTLSARAPRYVPSRVTVHILTGRAPNVTDVHLTSLKTYLDTIRVTASRVYTNDINGFEGRRRAGQGHYIDRAQIDRRQPTQPSDLLQMIPRVEVLPSAAGLFGRVVAFRRPMSFDGYCRPDLYIDGVLFRSGDMEIDEAIMPDMIEGIEVYTKPGLAPVQFTNNMSGCGSIVVWRRRLQEKPKEVK